MYADNNLGDVDVLIVIEVDDILKNDVVDEVGDAVEALL